MWRCLLWNVGTLYHVHLCHIPEYINPQNYRLQNLNFLEVIHNSWSEITTFCISLNTQMKEKICSVCGNCILYDRQLLRISKKSDWSFAHLKVEFVIDLQKQKRKSCDFRCRRQYEIRHNNDRGIGDKVYTQVPHYAPFWVCRRTERTQTPSVTRKKFYENRSIGKRIFLVAYSTIWVKLLFQSFLVQSAVHL